MPSDVDVEGDDVECGKNGVDGRLSRRSPLLVREFYADEKLGRCDRGKRDVGVVGNDGARDLMPALDGHENSGVDDQTFHGSVAVASPANRRRSRRSSAQRSSGGWSPRTRRRSAPVPRRAGAMVATTRPRRTTVNVSPRCSTASRRSAKRLEASVALISPMNLIIRFFARKSTVVAEQLTGASRRRSMAAVGAVQAITRRATFSGASASARGKRDARRCRAAGRARPRRTRRASASEAGAT